MNTNFLSENFLLQTETAKLLFHDYAKKMPIIDYHNHLPPEEIAQDKSFDNITSIWLNGDHYKWRAMRTMGVDEHYITGAATDKEKFLQWAKVVPYTMRNPLYHWTHMELAHPFGIKSLLNESTAEKIYEQTSEMLRSKEFSVKNILKKFNVQMVGTTDDPIDSLSSHKKIVSDNFDIKVLPSFRPDKGMTIEDSQSFNNWVDQLAIVCDKEIIDFNSYLEAIKIRHDYFAENGCRISDHGLETIYADDYTEDEVQLIFSKARRSEFITEEELKKFKSCMLYNYALLDHSKSWVQQFHIGALRNNNERMHRELGPDKGFDSIGDFTIGRSMAKFFNRLDNANQLTKTIIYNLNPRDNEMFATMVGNYNDGKIKGKMQFGSAWWFLDQKDGMEKQLNALSSLSLLSCFVGMLTDSRSFLSYSRHEYFRRILCNLIGNEVANGELPNDIPFLGKMVQDISFNNAETYFGLKK